MLENIEPQSPPPMFEDILEYHEPVPEPVKMPDDVLEYHEPVPEPVPESWLQKQDSNRVRKALQLKFKILLFRTAPKNLKSCVA